MNDQPNTKTGDEQATEGTIDYSKSQADIDKAKAAAHDADRKRLAEESGLTESG
jgi:hypothetical protein